MGLTAPLPLTARRRLPIHFAVRPTTGERKGAGGGPPNLSGMIVIYHRRNRLALWRADIETLRGADLSGAAIAGADLRDADLRDADLRFANLQEANLCGADLAGARLLGANLLGATYDERTRWPLLGRAPWWRDAVQVRVPRRKRPAEVTPADPPAGRGSELGPPP